MELSKCSSEESLKAEAKVVSEVRPFSTSEPNSDRFWWDWRIDELKRDMELDGLSAITAAQRSTFDAAGVPLPTVKRLDAAL